MNVCLKETMEGFCIIHLLIHKKDKLLLNPTLDVGSSYGSLISIKLDLMFMDLLKKHALNSIQSNLIFFLSDDYLK